MLHTGEYLEIRLTYCLIFNMKKYFERTNRDLQFIHICIPQLHILQRCKYLCYKISRLISTTVLDTKIDNSYILLYVYMLQAS